ncbi:MAG: heme ABC transporter ATP-binding protein [Gammaproteobacteria bacterium]
MIATHALGYDVAGRALLADCELAFTGGRVTAVLGPNGAGKSTLLRLLTGERRPSHGEVRVDGRALDTWTPAALARVRAVVTQFNHVAFPFTAAEIVALGRAPWRRSDTRAARAAAVEAALARLEVGHLAGRLYPTLSGGEQQRVAIARALAQLDWPRAGGARCLLLDEPSASLDLHHQHALMALLRELATQGVTVVVVLHDLNLALGYCDEVVLLREGRVAATGATAATLTPALVEAVYRVAAEQFETPDGGVFLVARRAVEYAE